MSAVGPITCRLGSDDILDNLNLGLSSEDRLSKLLLPLVLKVLSYLSAGQDLRNVGLTCKALFAATLNKSIMDYQVFRMWVQERAIHVGLERLPTLPVGDTIPLPSLINSQVFQDVRDVLDQFKAEWVLRLASLSQEMLNTLDEGVTHKAPQFRAVFKLALIASELLKDEGQSEIENPFSPLSLSYRGEIARDPRGALILLDMIKEPAFREPFRLPIAQSLINQGLVQRVLMLVEGMKDPQSRRSDYIQLPIQLAHMGDFKNAVAVGKLVGGSDSGAMIFRSIVSKMIESLKSRSCTAAYAEEIALSLPTQEDRDSAFLRLSSSLLIKELYDLDRSIIFASKINAQNKRIEAFSFICNFLLGNSGLKKALTIARQCLKENRELSQVVSNLAIEVCRRGDLKQGLKLISSLSEEERIRPLYFMAFIRLQHGYLGEALYLIGLIYTPQSELWMNEIYQLFNAAVSASRFKEALCLSKMMPNGNLKDMSLKTLTHEAIERSDLQSAIESAEEMSESAKKGAVRELFSRFATLDKG